jgi:hypothetical protein
VTGTLPKTGAVPRFNLTGLDEGSYSLQLSVSDGVNTTVANRNIRVNNVAPNQIVINTISGVKAGVPFTISGTFVDPGADTWSGELSLGSGLTFPLEFSGRSFAARNISLPWPGTYTATVTIHDADGGSMSRAVQFVASHVNISPVLNTVPTPAMTPVIQNSVSHIGDSVRTLLGTAFSDANAGSLVGIAVVVTDGRNGVWQFSLDDGQSWQSIGASSQASARLLSVDNRVRFLPNLGFVGSSSLQYRAWDLSAGRVGTTVNLNRVGALSTNSPAGAQIETAIVRVLAPPVLSVGGPVSTSLNSTAVALAATGDITDLDSVQFSAGRLSVSIRSGGTGFDRLSIVNQGTGSGLIGISGSNILFGGAVFGTVSGGTGTSPLIVRFTTSAATKLAVRALLRAITFECRSLTASKAQRTIDFTVTDETGVTGPMVTKLVNIL